MPEVSSTGAEVLVPHYDLIGQWGLDLQYTRGAWLWKLEAIRRSGQGRSFSAYAAGLEYTIYAIRRTNADLGLLIERLHNGRDASAPATALADDVFVGARLALNDVSDAMLLLGAIIDRENHGAVSFIEGQRRLWQRWRLEIELRLLDDANDRVLQGVRNDGFLTLRLARFL